jgi:A/G-specific adenine glycosylase
MTTDCRALVRAVWKYYQRAGRHTLPWRAHPRPYQVLVSELMLQQTQVTRVIPKYRAFMKAFPTVADLAAASPGQVLQLWQGLGYNRRAMLLHQTAHLVMTTYRGRFPRDEARLRTLPGVGPYTAAAIMAFAYNQSTIMIETNIRTVFLHHCFPAHVGVSDRQLLPLIAATVPADRARDWYAALMDYGSYLKQQHGNISRRSRAYTKQSHFKGSDRQLRGAVVRAVATHSTARVLICTLEQQLQEQGFSRERIRFQINKLTTEGLLTRQARYLTLPTAYPPTKQPG